MNGINKRKLNPNVEKNISKTTLYVRNKQWKISSHNPCITAGDFKDAQLEKANKNINKEVVISIQAIGEQLGLDNMSKEEVSVKQEASVEEILAILDTNDMRNTIEIPVPNTHEFKDQNQKIRELKHFETIDANEALLGKL